jgi:hypothetical protein
MTNTTTAICLPHLPSLEMVWRDVDSSFERFCLTAGIGAIEQMMREDAQQLTGAWHRRGGGRVGHRWGTTAGKIGFHGGGLRCIDHGCAASTAEKLRCRPGRRRRPRTGLAAGP